MQRQIDCYGFEATSEHFQRRKLEVYLVKNENAPAPKASGCLSEANPKGRKGPRGIIYECFGNGDPRPIHRIDHDPENAPVAAGDQVGRMSVANEPRSGRKGPRCVRVMWAYGRWADADRL